MYETPQRRASYILSLPILITPPAFCAEIAAVTPKAPNVMRLCNWPGACICRDTALTGQKGQFADQANHRPRDSPDHRRCDCWPAGWRHDRRTCPAIEMGADAIDISKTIHPHPTFGETIGLAAEVRRCLHGCVAGCEEVDQAREPLEIQNMNCIRCLAADRSYGTRIWRELLGGRSRYL